MLFFIVFPREEISPIIEPFYAKSNEFPILIVAVCNRAVVCEKRKQPLAASRNQTFVRAIRVVMATFRDPNQCFAPLEVVERLLEIRDELGYSANLYLTKTNELTDFLDSFGFDIYAFSTENKTINYGDYTAPVVPGGDTMHSSLKAH